MIKKNNPFFWYITTAILTCVILGWMFYPAGFDIRIPHKYTLDALFSSATIKNIIDTGWVTSNPQLGAPLMLNMTDYPNSDGASFFIIKILSLFTHDYAVVINLFFFATFLLTALIALYAFRRLKMQSALAVVASLLFTFIPFHFLRDEGHLFLTTLYVIPIYTLLIFSVFNQTRWSKWKWIFVVIVCMISASSSVYYAFFACYFLLIAGLLAWLNFRIKSLMIKPLCLIAVIMLTVVINTSPSMISKIKYGDNPELASRVPNESELYGLKISQLLFPVEAHRWHPLKLLRQHYDETAPLVNENKSATLGIIGSIGFIVLLLMLFAREKITSDTWYLLSRLNVSGFLLGTIGGLGAVYAYLISPMIRGYNRISVFIAFFAIYAFFLLLQDFLKKRYPNKNIILIAGLLLCVGILDQTNAKRNVDYQQIKSQYVNDEKFVAAIEKKMPQNSMIFQLPIIPFPENPPVNQLKDYDLFRGYLHSHTLHWSYGAIRGRQVIKWQQAVARLPVKEMLNELAYAGFTGIYLDRNGFLDQGKNLETQLTAILKQQPLISDDKTLVFYDMSAYVKSVKQLTTWNANVARVHNELMIERRWYDGFHHHETVNDNSRWTKSNNATIRVVNYADVTKQVNINFVIKTPNQQSAQIKISGDLINETVTVNSAGIKINKIVSVSPGPHYLYFSSDIKPTELPDKRVYFKIFENEWSVR
jgi:phosphoglycerol transferase